MTRAQELLKDLKATQKVIADAFSRRQAWWDIESSIQTVFYDYKNAPTDESKATLLAVIETHHAIANSAASSEKDIRAWSREEYHLADELCKTLAPVWFPESADATNVKVGVFRAEIEETQKLIRCANRPHQLIEDVTALRGYSCRAAKQWDTKAYKEKFEAAVYRLIELGVTVGDDDQPILPAAE